MPLPTQTLSYYGLSESNFRNSLYALDIALDLKFSNEYFKGDLTRIIYSKNNYALRKRIEKKENNIANLDFPFMNYRTKPNSISYGTSRPWKNTISTVKGVFINELGKNLRVAPISIEYEGTFWFQRNDDMNYVFQQLIYDNAVETILPYTINVSGQDVEMIAILKYKLEMDPTYDEQKWLETNKIHTIAIDITAETFYIKDEEVSIPEKILFNFAVNNNLGEQSISQLNQFISNHYTEVNTEI